jgi:hypothetical protein
MRNWRALAPGNPSGDASVRGQRKNLAITRTIEIRTPKQMLRKDFLVRLYISSTALQEGKSRTSEFHFPLCA